MNPVPDASRPTPMQIPHALNAAMGISAAIVLVVGVLPAGLRPHRRPRRRRAGPSGRHGRARRADPPRAGRSRSAPSSTPRCTTRRPGSSPAAAGPAGRAATSSPAPRSVRCSARCVARGPRPVVGRPRRPGPVRRGRGRRRAPARCAARCCAAAPGCAPALRYVLVERSAALREAQRELLTVEPFEHALGPSTPRPGRRCRTPVERERPDRRPRSTSSPRSTIDGVVLANELLDNLPFDLVERTGDGWLEIRVGVTDSGAFVRGAGSAASDEIGAGSTGSTRPSGTRLPVQRAAGAWVDDCATAPAPRRGGVIDYARRARRPGDPRQPEWLRTYRGHDAGRRPARRPRDAGHHDATSAPDAAPRGPARRVHGRRRNRARRSGSRSLGIDDLVEAGRRTWEAGAARRRPRGSRRPQPGHRGRGAHRSGRPRRAHRRRPHQAPLTPADRTPSFWRHFRAHAAGT